METVNPQGLIWLVRLDAPQSALSPQSLSSTTRLTKLCQWIELLAAPAPAGPAQLLLPPLVPPSSSSPPLVPPRSSLLPWSRQLLLAPAGPAQVLLASAGPARHFFSSQNPIGSFQKGLAQPPTPASSVIASQFISPVCAGTWDCLGSPSARQRCWVSCVIDLQPPTASGVAFPKSSPAAPETRTPPRTSDPAAPPRLLTHQPTSFTRLPRPFGYNSSICPFCSVRLLLPPRFTSILCHPYSTVVFRIPVSASVSRIVCFALALCTLGVTRTLRLIISTMDSSSVSSVSRPPGFISPSSNRTPSSGDSTVGLWTTAYLLHIQARPMLLPPSF
ncbi:hypothetical protein E1301_Tti012624 [Triplophysa tibetana]|uniref:Uncharacterized protein n=1 Tax=Triplophysa tibetana TaxID=1572043 RepID=A0A5A9NKG6_9TELE|nr:hypothetical protein E1301_Tti012624 [Triplophysa tibetana]